MRRLLRALRRPTRHELRVLVIAIGLSVAAFVIERLALLPQPYEFIVAMLVRAAGIYLALRVGDMLLSRDEQADSSKPGTPAVTA